MTNKQKVKGTEFENQVADYLNKAIVDSYWRRIPGSGAIGTVMGEALLTGDISGEVEGFYKKFKGECKAGYGGKTQLTLKKEWLDKIKTEAEVINCFPLFFGKFLGARTGVKQFVVLDIVNFVELMNEYLELKKDYDKLYIKIEEAKTNGFLGSN